MSTDLLRKRKKKGREWNHFQRLNEVKELKFSFSRNARIREAGIEQGTVATRCLGANSPEPRRRAVTKWHVITQKTSSYITVCTWLPGLIVGPCPSEESLCCPACPPTLPFFRRFSAPVSKVVCFISLYLLSTCMYHSFSHITFLGYNHTNSRASVILDSLLSEHIIRYHMCPWGRLLPLLPHTVFSSKGVVAVRARRLFPVDHIYPGKSYLWVEN